MASASFWDTSRRLKTQQWHELNLLACTSILSCGMGARLMSDNTLLGRCTADLQARRICVAIVFDQLATEIAAMLERNPNLTPHQIITILRMEAAGELAGFEHEPA